MSGSAARRLLLVAGDWWLVAGQRLSDGADRAALPPPRKPQLPAANRLPPITSHQPPATGTAA